MGRVDGAGTHESGPATDPTPGGSTDLAAAAGAACLQGTLRSCVVPLPAQGGVHNCFSGKQLCTAGAWTDCEDQSALVGARPQSFVASCPATKVARWTTLAYSVDAPANASGAADVTIALAEHPEVVVLDTGANNGVPAKGGIGARDLLAILGSSASQSTLNLQVVTSTTPDGELASTATISAQYDCVAASP